MENGEAINEFTAARTGFELVQDPVVPNREALGDDELPASYGIDLLRAIARDPKSLFVYWDVNWSRLFDRAGLSRRTVHLRVYRDEGKVDSSREINPFRGHCDVEVTMADTVYSCELGCFDGRDWVALVRSGKIVTPGTTLSEDLSAVFATLPLHLSFERLLEILDETAAERETLALSVAELQATVRETESEIPSGPESSDLGELIASAPAALAEPRNEQQEAKWGEISRRLAAEAMGGSSLPDE